MIRFDSFIRTKTNSEDSPRTSFTTVWDTKVPDVWPSFPHTSLDAVAPIACMDSIRTKAYGDESSRSKIVIILSFDWNFSFTDFEEQFQIPEFHSATQD